MVQLINLSKLCRHLGMLVFAANVIQYLACIRAIPNMTVIRPADGNEVSGAYAFAASNAHGPTVLALSRQVCM